MAGQLRKSVVMVGLMGVGKTAVGRALAAQIGVPFVDCDDAIVEAANMSIPDIFARDGEAFFRSKETQVLKRLLDGPPGVLSTGGGAFLSPVNQEAIAQAGLSVWLDADLPVIWDRVRNKSGRPLLQTKDPRGTLERLARERRPAYEKADLRIHSVPGLTVAETAQQVLQALRQQPGLFKGDLNAGR